MVAQLRIIFTPNYTNAYMHHVPLAYVQPFKFTSGATPVPEAGTNMYRLKREIYNGQRKGFVVPLTCIWRPVELTPLFGSRCDANWTSDSAVEESVEFYLNCYASLEDFIEIY